MARTYFKNAACLNTIKPGPSASSTFPVILFMNVFTQLLHPLHLYHEYFHYHPALPLAFTQPHSAACQVCRLAPKVIQSLVLMGPDIALIVSAPRRAAALCDGRRRTPAFVNNSIPKGKLTKWVLSNYLCGEMIFSTAGGIPTVHIDSNDACARGPAIWKIYWFYKIANEYFAHDPALPPLPFPAFPCLNQLNKLAWYLMACELQL